jgi:riboflavin kinase/FMN adenylyltransferase
MEIINEMAATIGFFDGVHTGHRFLFEQLKTQAEIRKLPTMAITFRQHPQQVLKAGFQPELLSTLDERIARLSLLEIDYCLLLDFTRQLSQMSAKEFIQKTLRKKCKVQLLFIGHNHRFGKNRIEGFEEYVKYGKGCGMEILQALEYPDTPVSATLIRNHLSEGKIKEANRLLSYHYCLEGKVIAGNHLGRKIGFPTANIEVSDKSKIIPADGIYAVRVCWNEKTYKGMVYIGKRPTVSNQGEKRIEVHLLGFSGDLYGETLRLEFVEYLREEKRFENMDELKEQLLADRRAAIGVMREPK